MRVNGKNPKNEIIDLDPEGRNGLVKERFNHDQKKHDRSLEKTQ